MQTLPVNATYILYQTRCKLDIFYSVRCFLSSLFGQKQVLQGDLSVCSSFGNHTVSNSTEDILIWAAGVAEPDVLTAETIPALKWGECDEEGLVSFLVGEKNFSEERVRSAIRKLNANKGKSSQGRPEYPFFCNDLLVLEWQHGVLMKQVLEEICTNALWAP